MIHYGTIRVYLNKGLTYDQLFSVIQSNVSNQLMTDSREHYYNILGQCVSLAGHETINKVSIECEEFAYNFEVYRID